MHYFAGVVVPINTTREQAEKAVDPILASHEEGYNVVDYHS